MFIFLGLITLSLSNFLKDKSLIERLFNTNRIVHIESSCYSTYKEVYAGAMNWGGEENR
jgi:hypothetical protein